jgi:hypothetical protein
MSKPDPHDLPMTSSGSAGRGGRRPAPRWRWKPPWPDRTWRCAGSAGDGDGSQVMVDENITKVYGRYNYS